MIDNKSIQQALRVLTFYQGPMDGLLGPLSHDSVKAAITKYIGGVGDSWKQDRKLIAFQQLMMHLAGIEVGKLDGIKGPQTLHALELWQNRQRDIPSPPTPPKPDTVVIQAGDKRPTSWPTQTGVPQYYGPVGQSQERVTPPYQLYLYDSKTKVNTISLHSKVAPSAVRVLTRVAEIYSPRMINDLHLNRYFGALNVRKMRGGNSWSMHSWGIAIDFDANRNQLRWGRDRAAFAKPVYEQWWKAWEDEGWVSLGREKNFDYMHIQAARL